MSIAEAVQKQRKPLGAALAAGVESISYNQTVTFTKYVKVILPLDGFVFWVKADLVSGTAQKLLFPADKTIVPFGGTAITAVNGPVGGGFITNPYTAADQGISVAEPLYYSFTGAAALGETADTFPIWPGQTILIPTDMAGDVSVNAATSGHKFSAIVYQTGASVTVKGSMHYSSQTNQNEDETYGLNRMVFTSEQEIEEFNTVGPNTMFIGEFDGLKFAFSNRRSFYEQSGLHHYVGDAVYPAMQSQVVDSIDDLSGRELVVSNSLPIWLSLNSYRLTNSSFSNPGVVLYPSYLVEENIVPPYGSVHIFPDDTQAIASAPWLGSTLQHDQLVIDRVRLTLYGLTNDQALDFMDYVNQFSLDTDLIGIMNIPTVRDQKRVQSELNAIAMKKTVEFQVNYYQRRVRDVARQLILSAIPTFYFQ